MGWLERRQDQEEGRRTETIDRKRNVGLDLTLTLPPRGVGRGEIPGPRT